MEKSNFLKMNLLKISSKLELLIFRQLSGLKANLPFNDLKYWIMREM